MSDELLKSILLDAREVLVESQQKLQQVADKDWADLKVAYSQLNEALDLEQTGYERLLQAMGREFRMTKSGEAEPADKRQSKQAMNLKLSQKKRNYNDDRRADAEPVPLDEELAMHFKRMADLAKRQEAVTEQLKQLLAALESATKPEDKAEIERKLKRLREEQREMLSDIDKILEKLDRMGRSEELAETMQALEKARKQASEASKAMSEDNLAKAQTASKRAEEKMNQSTEEMRKANASQFAAHMDKLRESADKLAENQAKLTEKLANQAQSNEPSGKKTRQDHEKQIRKQQKDLADVLEQMRDITEASEDQESLLSSQLYEAIRNVETRGTTESLDDAVKQVRRGAYNEASEHEAVAAENISQLQKEIETAANSVMGSETEALKRADEQLAQLLDDLEKENRRGQSKGKDPSKEGEANGESMASADTDKPGQQGKGETPSDQGKGKGQGKGETPGKGESESESIASGKGKGQGEGKGKGGSPGKGESESESMASGKGKGKGKGQGEGESENESMASGKGKGKGKGQGQGQGEGESESESMASNNEGEGRGQGSSNAPRKPTDQVITGEGKRGAGDNRKLAVPGGRKAAFLDAFDQETPVDFGDDRPITGEDYQEWMERLKDVELMVSNPDLKREITRVRLRSREFRTDFKRNSRPPEWDVMETGLIKPLRRIRSDVQNEIARQEGDEQKVRVDRDPAPVAYKDLVERYYQKLSAQSK